MARGYRGLAAALEQAQAGRVRPPFQRPRPGRVGYKPPGLIGLDRLVLPPQPAPTPPALPFSRNQMASAVGQPAGGDRFAGMISPQSVRPGVTPQHGGLFGNVLKALDFGRGAIVSTLKETIDLFQLEAPNPGEWWNQATSHYGFADLIRDERNTVGWGLAALGAATLNPYLGAASYAVLSDSKWADRIIGFVGDVALDPLTYAGGLNIYARAWGSYRKAGIALAELVNKGKDAKYLMSADDLVRLGLATNVQEAQAVRDVVGKAIARGAHDRSLVGFRRSLSKSGEIGERVMKATGLDTGLRIRLPGTGPIGQFMERTSNLIPGRKALRGRIDRTLGAMRGTPDGRFVGDWFDARRVSNIPSLHLEGTGVGAVASALKAHRTAQRTAGQRLKAGWRDPTKGLDPKAVEVAGTIARRHVEFKPTFGGRNIGAKFFGQADFIKRGFKRVAVDPRYFRRASQARSAGAAFGDPGVSLEKAYGGMYDWWRSGREFNEQWLRGMVRSGDPEQIATGWRIADAGRMARGAGNLIDDSVKSLRDKLVKRVTIDMGGQAVNKDLVGDAYHILEGSRAGADLIVDGKLNRASLWFHNLSPEVQQLPDKAIERLAVDSSGVLDDITRALVRTYGTEVGGEEPVWRVLEDMFGEEGVGHVTRSLSEESRHAFGITWEGGARKPPLTGEIHTWDYEVSGRMTPRALKDRKWGVGRVIKLPEATSALSDAQAKGYAWMDVHGVHGSQGEWYLKADSAATGPFTPVKPNSVGKSVRTQIDEVSLKAYGRLMYEDDILAALGIWKSGLKRDVATHSMWRLAQRDLAALEIAPDIRARLTQQIDEGATSWDMGPRRVDWSGRTVKGRGRTPGDVAGRELVTLHDLLLGGRVATEDVLADVNSVLRRALQDAGVSDDLIENISTSQRVVWETVAELDVAYSELEVIGRKLEAIFQANGAKIAKGKYRVSADVRNMLLRAHQIAARVEEIKGHLFDPDEGVVGVVERLFNQLPDLSPPGGVAPESVALAELVSAFDTNIAHIDDLIRAIADDPATSQLGLINSKISQLNAADKTVRDLGDLARGLDPEAPVVRQVDEARAAVGADDPVQEAWLHPQRRTRSLQGWATQEVRRQGAPDSAIEDLIAGLLRADDITADITAADIIDIHSLVAPGVRAGYRTTPVAFASGGAASKAADIQRQMDLLVESGLANSDPDEFVRQFLRIHPFEDGNGRVGAVLLNHLSPRPWREAGLRSLPDFFDEGTGVAPRIRDYTQTVRAFRSADAVVHHQAELRIGVTQQVDMAETQRILDEVLARTGQLTETSRVETLARQVGSAAGRRQMPTTVDELRFMRPTSDEILAAVSVQHDDAVRLTDEAVAFRAQAQTAVKALVDRASQLGLNVSAGLDGQFHRLESQIRASGIAELMDALEPIALSRQKALAAELSGQAAAREAADILSWSEVGRQVEGAAERGAVLERGGHNIFENVDGFADLRPDDMRLFVDMMKDSASNWGPWRVLSGNAELDEAMVVAADLFQKMNSTVEVKGFAKGFDAFQNWWKAGAIATPGFVNRNIFGAFYNAWLSDVNLNEIVRAGFASSKIGALARRENITFMQAAQRLAKDNDYFKDYVRLLELGVRGKGQATRSVQLGGRTQLGQENRGVLDQVATGLRWAKSMDIYIPTGAGRAPFRASLAPWSSNFALFRAVRSANMQAEDVIRLGTGMDMLRWGGSLDDALDRIATTQFDYSELTATERRFNQRLIPFYTWVRKNVPYQLERLGRNPSKFNRILTTKRNLEFGTEDKGDVPDFYLEPYGIRMPFSWGGARVYSVPDIPFQDVFRLDPTRQKEGEGVTYGLGEFANQAIWQMSPIIKAPIEWFSQSRFLAAQYGGVPFSGEFEETPSVITNFMGVGNRTFMPLLASIGWARMEKGEWQMRDHHVNLILNLLPTLSKFRRLWPSEERFQQNLVPALVSTFGGISARPQTEEVQSSWRDWVKIRERERRRRAGVPPLPTPRRDPDAPGGFGSGGFGSGGTWD